MWHDVFAQQLPFAEKVIRTVAIYALLVVLFRLTGKRGLASMTTFDVIVISLLSNVVQNAIIGADNSLVGGVIGAVTLVAVNSAVNRLILVDRRAQWLFEGTPTAVIADGRVVGSALRRLGLRRSELEHAVRLQNGDDIAQVDHGSLEPGGQLVLTLKPVEQGATKSDIDALQAQLHRIEERLRAPCPRLLPDGGPSQGTTAVVGARVRPQMARCALHRAPARSRSGRSRHGSGRAPVAQRMSRSLLSSWSQVRSLPGAPRGSSPPGRGSGEQGLRDDALPDAQRCWDVTPALHLERRVALRTCRGRRGRCRPTS